VSHPIRKAEVHTFQRQNSNGKGREWIAQFYPYSIYPVFFSGPTEDAVTAQAEAMRNEAIDKHEAACIARQEAKAKAAATRVKKAAP
jgi:hypothetical protein